MPVTIKLQCVAYYYQRLVEIFGIRTSYIITRLKDINNNTNYADKHGGAGWFTDQEHLWYAVKRWPGFQSRFKVVHDRNTGYRPCRSTFNFFC